MHLFLLLLLLFARSVSAYDEDRYGYHVPNTPLYLSGYISMHYDPKEQHDLMFDDIALLLYANQGKYHLLGEVEISNFALQDIDDSNVRLYIERLHMLYDIDEFTSVTVGKFNSDIGFWNITRISTLTATTTSPHLVENIFPQMNTGVMLTRSFVHDTLILSTTLQQTPNIDRDYNNFDTTRHYGFALSYPTDFYTLKLNGGYYETEDTDDNNYYAGISLQYELEQWSLQSELFTRQNNLQGDIPYDGYLQYIRHLNYHYDLVFRQELYKDSATDTEEGISIAGFVYRPRIDLVFKGEYVYHSQLDDDRFVFSFSAVF